MLALWLLCLLWASLSAVNAAKEEGPQLALVSHGDEVVSGIVGSFCKQIEAHSLVRALWRRPPSEKNALGCVPWKKSKAEASFIAIVARGNCSFVIKAQYARDAGAQLVLVISSDESLSAMSGNQTEIAKAGGKESLPVTIMVSKSDGQLLTEDSDSLLSVSVYERLFYDPMSIIVVCLATLIVASGALYAKHLHNWKPADSRSPDTSQSTLETAEIEARSALFFVVVSSTTLVVLFYLAQYLFVAIVTLFSIAAAFCVGQLAFDFLVYLFPKWPTHKSTVTLYTPCATQYATTEAFTLAASFLVAGLWLFNRTASWAWILQDFLCICLLLTVQPVIDLPNLKIASILLGTAFVYDIFWVFLSPLLFEQSVMLKVATYSHGGNGADTLPAVLKFPKLNDPMSGMMVLGLGDIALPGLLVTQLLRVDCRSGAFFRKHWTDGYFWPVLVGYAVGLVLTYLNMLVMRQGQPALLFLVPCTLGLVSLLAWRRGEFWKLWETKSVDKKNLQTDEEVTIELMATTGDEDSLCDST